ncbi:glycerol-3-phosphate 1-O-acyltransferase PlsY [Draconibacterium halophilum]|uniref:Glycerol-3-phosphate acyltransferase n=1 Tax=Draconibacterium halophilum TaxID=2706887 RepID=A0A6C0R972_9BACT|nr:glycerol-3-phosphate 1-O-acyltransferase PlsY [Draconibacterium halophilum]QIA06492.1 glycerol-3-phosphate 1-O-acyltransferase PlsY [Draconibacterium halophilum]
MNNVVLIVLLFFTYLWGSIPVGYLVVYRIAGKNILEHGSGNIGSTNVGRIVGKKWSLFTQLLDMLKGLLPVALFLVFSGQQHPRTGMYVYLFGLAAILGHNFSIFLKFNGGKGVNTTLGAAVLLAPVAVFCAVAMFFVIKKVFKYVSLGSMMLGTIMPVVEYIQNGISYTFYFLLLCLFLILLRHRNNIRRLLNRSENKA